MPANFVLDQVFFFETSKNPGLPGFRDIWHYGQWGENSGTPARISDFSPHSPPKKKIHTHTVFPWKKEEILILPPPPPCSATTTAAGFGECRRISLAQTGYFPPTFKGEILYFHFQTHGAWLYIYLYLLNTYHLEKKCVGNIFFACFASFSCWKRQTWKMHPEMRFEKNTFPSFFFCGKGKEHCDALTLICKQQEEEEREPKTDEKNVNFRQQQFYALSFLPCLDVCSIFFWPEILWQF